MTPKSQSSGSQHRRDQKRYRDANWEYRLLTNAKVNQKRKNLEFTLDRAFLKLLWSRQKERCFWTQVPMLKSGPPKHPQKVSLDRIDPSKGYTEENVVLTCQFANLGKCDVDIRTFFGFLQVLRSTFTAVTVVNRESSESQPSTETE